MPIPSHEYDEIGEFWRKCKEDIEKIVNFEDHVLPMDFLEKMVQAESADIRMTTDTLLVLSKVFELFVKELSFLAWKCAMSHGRSIILESDIAEAVASTSSYNFLNGFLCNHGELCSTSLVQASTSNITPQLLQERISLMANGTDTSMMENTCVHGSGSTNVKSDDSPTVTTRMNSPQQNKEKGGDEKS